MVEESFGFASYQITDKDCYVEDVYVDPDHRLDYRATRLIDAVLDLAKEAGCETVSTTVNCGFKNPTASLKAALSYGFKVSGASNNIIILRMEI